MAIYFKEFKDFKSENFFCEYNKNLITNIYENNFINKFIYKNLENISNYPNEFNDEYNSNSYTIYSDKKITVFFRMIEKSYMIEYLERKELNDIASDALVYNIGEGKIRIERFNTNKNYDNEEFSTNLKLEYNSSELLIPNTFFELRKGSDVIKIIDISDNVFQLVVKSNLSMKYYWNYDAETLVPKNIFSSNNSPSRIFLFIKLLTKMNSINSIEVIENLKEHSDYHIRWEVVKSILQLDKERGLLLLNKSLSDKNYQIQKAAIKTLNELKINSII
ncbi:HEAT repeat domain-containing protein [Pigmentibacter sp. JX0631]|uniref:HEAT repeat domain-containing protein n=1 Tax=Pigmentibacter sp. JX0631 TaxID=2976982 RepID=UPI0024696D5F|nr:HEAT repeat domain-containing protein [Pigmentibacter sp. JX0631]WGL58642.1 HEAT repeat domain-containing protein [Pigmentibacter sp. JX0631]